MIFSSLPTIKELKIISVFKKEKLSRTYKRDTSKKCRIQDKGSRFVVLDSDSYTERIDR